MDGIAGTQPILVGVATNRIMSTTQNAKWIRDQFPGNIIPQSRIDPVVSKLLGYTP